MILPTYWIDNSVGPQISSVTGGLQVQTANNVEVWCLLFCYPGRFLKNYRVASEMRRLNTQVSLFNDFTVVFIFSCREIVFIRLQPILAYIWDLSMMQIQRLFYWSTWWRHQMETFTVLLALCVRGIHWSSVDSPHKGQWCGALISSLTCAWTNGWANHRDTGDVRRKRPHYDVT